MLSCCRIATRRSVSIVATRSFASRTPVVWAAADLPYHLVVGLPALSPTMESGSLSEWNVQEGDSFSAGDLLAKIETDKAAMDFEAQDDGVVAKILVPAGSGKDLALGEPIMVTVEDEADVAAFADFSLPEGATPAPPPVVETKPAAVAPPPPQTPPPVAPPVAAPVAPPPPVVLAASPVVAASLFPSVDTTSPLAKIMAQQQKEYIAKYGTTYFKPLLDDDEAAAA